MLAVKLAELYVAEEVKLDRAVELLENLVRTLLMPNSSPGAWQGLCPWAGRGREQFEWVIENSRALERKLEENLELDRGERSGVMGQGLD